MSAAHFDGFSPDGLAFLLELEENNNKAWFEANKPRYQDGIVAHAPAFVAALGERLQEGISPAITYDTRTNGAGSMMRIYRDVRFSKDKTPYKTNAAFIFWEGPRKKMENPSFGFQFGTFGAGLYGGVFGFSKEMLEKYRKAVVDERLGPQLVDAIAQVTATGEYALEGDKYKRVPSGFDPDHPRAELLLYKGLHAMAPQFDVAIVTTPDLVDVCYERCLQMAPIQQWLVQMDQSSL
jgi:uncharacterized protein (TIGR02453 family)